MNFPNLARFNQPSQNPINLVGNDFPTRCGQVLGNLIRPYWRASRTDGLFNHMLKLGTSTSRWHGGDAHSQVLIGRFAYHCKFFGGTGS